MLENPTLQTELPSSGSIWVKFPGLWASKRTHPAFCPAKTYALEELKVLSGIGDTGAFDVSERRDVVRLGGLRAQDVGHRHASNGQGIGD